MLAFVTAMASAAIALTGHEQECSHSSGDGVVSPRLAEVTPRAMELSDYL
jgi:hypothetical protein